jgi:DNA-directed RNA polymerase I, II, and III subunit RPABC2
MSDNGDYFSDEISDNEDIESDDDDEKKMSIIKKFDENNIEKILNNSDDEDDEEEEDKNDYYDEEKDQNGGGVEGDSSENEEDEDEDEESENEDILAPKTKKPAKITIDPTLDDDENEDDEDEEEDENYLQKFDREISKNYITDQHPECAIHNYDEIAKLSFIVRDNDNIIVDPLHKTLPFLTKYEKARTLGQRSKQIECGATPLIKVPEGIIDAHIIAELELQQKRIPFIIRRPIPGGGSEYWNLKDLDIITF